MMHADPRTVVVVAAVVTCVALLLITLIFGSGRRRRHCQQDRDETPDPNPHDHPPPGSNERGAQQDEAASLAYQLTLYYERQAVEEAERVALELENQPEPGTHSRHKMRVVLLYRSALMLIPKDEYAEITNRASEALERLRIVSGHLNDDHLDRVIGTLEVALSIVRRLYGGGGHWLEAVILYDMSRVSDSRGENFKDAAVQYMYQARWASRTLDAKKYPFLRMITMGSHPIGMNRTRPTASARYRRTDRN